MRIGHGYDVHRFAEGRRLVLGGVEIDYGYGLAGHSDADVLTHAVMDALLGACALGDIGKHFPDTDPEYEGADSMELLRRVHGLIYQQGYELSNLDVTVICEKPKLRNYIESMRCRLSEALCADVGDISVKATTEEGLGFTGEGLGRAVHAVCLLKERN